MDAYDFYFKVSKADGSVQSVEQVRLYGDSSAFLAARSPSYTKDGFKISPATRDEYRRANWRK